MGQIDLDKLFNIYYEALFIAKKFNLPYRFKVDEGTYETAIEFINDTAHHPPISQTWQKKPIIFCPDLLDYPHKIIIEYEEEVGDTKLGARLAKKGHNREGDFNSKRDELRNKYYALGGFTVLRIWESDETWRSKLKDFMLNFTPLQ